MEIDSFRKVISKDGDFTVYSLDGMERYRHKDADKVITFALADIVDPKDATT